MYLFRSMSQISRSSLLPEFCSCQSSGHVEAATIHTPCCNSWCAFVRKEAYDVAVSLLALKRSGCDVCTYVFCCSVVQKSKQNDHDTGDFEGLTVLNVMHSVKLVYDQLRG